MSELQPWCTGYHPVAASPQHSFLVRIEQPKQCPECRAAYDDRYGFTVLVRGDAFVAGLTDQVVRKCACYACGYHQAIYVPCAVIGAHWAQLKGV